MPFCVDCGTVLVSKFCGSCGRAENHSPTYVPSPANVPAPVIAAASSSLPSLSAPSNLLSLPGNIINMEASSFVTGAVSCATINNRIAELMGAVFANRDDAYTAVQLLSSWQGRKGKQDSSKCWGGGITVVCESAVKSVQVPKKVGDSSIGAVNAAGEPAYLNKMERASTVCGFCVRVNLRSAGTWAVSKIQDPTTLRHSVVCTTRVRPSCREITHTLGSIVSNDRTVSGKAIAGDARAAGLLQSNTSFKTNKPEYHRVMRAARGIRDGSQFEYVEGYSKIPEYVK